MSQWKSIAGARVTLEGISQHGKNRIREHGTDWELLEKREEVSALGGKSGLLLRAPDGDARWIAEEDDQHFQINQVATGK